MGLTAVMWTTHHGEAFDTEDWQIPDGIVDGEDVQANVRSSKAFRFLR